jgi:hypothetical protein
MEMHTVVEHICLASDQEDSPEDRVTNASFTQRSKWHCSEFTVFNEHYIEIERSGFAEKPQCCQIDLSVLSSKPRRLICIDWIFMALALALFALATVSGAAGAVGRSASITALLLAAALLALGLALLRSSDRMVYFSKHGRAPLLVLRNRNPDRAALQAFVHDISERIRRTRNRWSDRQGFLSAELREHRRIYEQGMLSRRQYERAKRRILKRH